MEVADDYRSLSFEAQRRLAFASDWNDGTLPRRASFPWYMDGCKSLETKPRSPFGGCEAVRITGRGDGTMQLQYRSS
jgi:hypothetical protein